MELYKVSAIARNQCVGSGWQEQGLLGGNAVSRAQLVYLEGWPPGSECTPGGPSVSQPLQSMWGAFKGLLKGDIPHT